MLRVGMYNFFLKNLLKEIANKYCKIEKRDFLMIKEVYKKLLVLYKVYGNLCS